jgi:hypothetical protein
MERMHLRDLDLLLPQPAGWEAERMVRAREILEWTHKVPKAKRNPATNSDGGTNPIYVSGRLIASISSPGLIVAAEPETGRILWKHHVGYLANDAFVADEELLFGGGSSHLSAIRIDDGSVAWEFVPDVAGKECLYATPLLDGDRVTISDRAGWLHRLRRDDGRPVWSVRIDPNGNNANGSPNLLDGLILTGTNSGVLAACDPDSGELKWTVRLDAPIVRKCEAFHGRVLASTREGLTLIEGGNGSIESRWVPQGECIQASLATQQGILVVLESRTPAPLPDSPEATHHPKRLVLVDERFEEAWSIPYGPHKFVHLTYDPELDLAFETTFSGLGIVDVRHGVRRCVVFAFPEAGRVPGDYCSPPCRIGEHLYGVTLTGSLMRMRLPE